MRIDITNKLRGVIKGSHTHGEELLYILDTIGLHHLYHREMGIRKRCCLSRQSVKNISLDVRR